MCKRLGNGSTSFDADDKILPQTGSSSDWIERIVRYADADTASNAASVNIWQTFIQLTVVVCRSRRFIGLDWEEDRDFVGIRIYTDHFVELVTSHSPR